MNIAELKGEKTVKTLAKRLLADPTKDTPANTQAQMEAALLRLNPQLNQIGELDKGTPIIVPDDLPLDPAQSVTPTKSLGAELLQQAEAALGGIQAVLKAQAAQPATQINQVQAWLKSDQAKALLKQTPALKEAFSSAASAAKALPKEQAATASAQAKALAEIQSQLAAFRAQSST
jgi:enamine deaminase RidA (YjgF/YER057c/UK114 family)